jgi:cupin fold WbuC family metalloprotein
MLSKCLSSSDLQLLVRGAEVNARRRQHSNVHARFDEPCQRVLIAMQTDSYIQPHRHSLDPKEETLVALLGLFALVTFCDEGRVAEVVRFGSDKFGGGERIALGVTIPPCVWHTVIALQPGSVLLEVKAGPFDPGLAKELANWAPTEQSPESAEFVKALRELVDRA